MIKAAGATIIEFTWNLSFIKQPCVCVATTVVSEINDRLSPKYAPPTITAVIIATLKSVECATPAAIGTSATTVPTLVPIDMEIKQAARKRPGKSIVLGR